MESKQQKAPALEGGLDILELLGESGDGLGFNELENRASLTRASVARVLKIMCERHYIVKDETTGKYKLGHKMARLSRRLPLLDDLQRLSEPTLRTITDEFENTAIAFYWDGGVFTAIAKVTHPESVVMQSVGEVFDDLAIKPWGWIVIGELMKKKKWSLERIVEGKRWEASISQDWIDFYLTNGFVFDDCHIYPERKTRRLAAPIWDESGHVRGAIAVGGTIFTLPDDQIKEVGDMLIRHGKKLSEIWNERM